VRSLRNAATWSAMDAGDAFSCHGRGVRRYFGLGGRTVEPELVSAVSTHVENELAMHALVQHHAANPQALPPRRGSGLVQLLRNGAGALPAIVAAANGDPAALASMMMRLSPAVLTAECVHLLGIYWGSVATQASTAQAAAFAWGESLACWHALARTPAYCMQIAGSVLGAGEIRDPEQMVAQFLVGRWEAVAAVAKSGARSLTPASGAAIAVLAHAQRTLARAGVGEPVRCRVLELCARARLDAEEEALAPVREQLRSAQSQNLDGVRRMRLLEPLFAIWAWAGGASASLEGEARVPEARHAGSMAVEVFTLAEVAPIASELRLLNQDDALRLFAKRLLPIIDQLAARVREGSGFAHAALAAEAYEMCALQNDVAESIRYCDLALDVCPGHPRAKSSLAHYLISQANLWLIEVPFPMHKRERLESNLQRAAELDPTDSRLELARERARKVDCSV
jgi:hypothetical protein